MTVMTHRTPTPSFFLLSLIVACLAGPIPVAAQEFVDLELVLAVDVSSSVDDDEYDLQMRGLSEAFRNPDILEAIQTAGGNGIAVAVVQWSEKDQQVLAVNWTKVADSRSANALSRKIRNAPRALIGGQTSIGGAIEFSLGQFAGSPFDGWRKVIDLSGDGRANSGVHPMTMRDQAMAVGVTINALAILNEEPFLDSYYRNTVIGGNGAFLMIADDYEDYAAAILSKLLREIGVPLANRPQPEPRLADAGAAATLR